MQSWTGAVSRGASVNMQNWRPSCVPFFNSFILPAVLPSRGALYPSFWARRAYTASSQSSTASSSSAWPGAGQKPVLPPPSIAALERIRAALKSKPPGTKKQLSNAEKRNFQGNIGKWLKNGGRPEFHGIERNSNNHIKEATDKFLVVIRSSKNNCFIYVQNRSRGYRLVFQSYAGNVNYSKTAQQTPQCTYRIAQNVARKCRRLGITHADLRFRKLYRVNDALQAFQAHGLAITSITHAPRLPKGCFLRPRKRRRV
eukprot:GDKH01025516.1.p1 GENE.GDKH01025516.1~~GDKH01025516.1.p1  ORF type:complete len:257 (-),score=3.97 GDKH01025516.1:124-894(-)